MRILVVISLLVYKFTSFNHDKFYKKCLQKKIEDILSWQKARELNKVVGKLIDGGKFKRSYRFDRSN
jgi:hypothetical protein